MNAINARNIFKRYLIEGQRSTSLKERVIHNWFRSPEAREIWALKDVSFSLEQGRTLGIIGANGSGKSTLLKIISGITPPTQGEIYVQGRVASLLELGAGFHPELSGMENIYLNGSLLGLSHKKIDSALKDIIAFAELEEFIYMPVKHYSSGMLMRLGFSVAVHVNPDILILDEVMAVGDSYFQEKSAEKIVEFKKHGKTILLVTHNLDHAERISDQILWLDKGLIKVFGKIQDVVVRFMREFYDQKLEQPPIPFNLEFANFCPSSRMGTGEVLISRIVITDEGGREVRTVYAGETMRVEIHYTAKREGTSLEAVMGIARFNGISITRVDSSAFNEKLKNAPRRGVIIATFSPLLITRGRYHLSVALNPPGKIYEPYDIHLRFYEFKIQQREKTKIRGAIKHPVHFEIRERIEE